MTVREEAIYEIDDEIRKEHVETVKFYMREWKKRGKSLKSCRKTLDEVTNMSSKEFAESKFFKSTTIY